MSRQNGDPASTEGRGKSCEKRMGRYDGSYTPTEQKIKDGLMKQFCKLPEGEVNASAWRASPVWCERCGYFPKIEPALWCAKCIKQDRQDEIEEMRGAMLNAIDMGGE